MPTPITMPRLSDQMEEGVVLRWLKTVGETVAKGDELLEIETDKATWIVEADADGTLTSILVEAGRAAAVGSTIAELDGGEAPAQASPAPAVEAAPAPASGAAPPPAPAATAAPGADRPRATPVARRTAAQLGVALDGVTGTGPGGRIVRADVLAASGAGAAAAAPAPAAPVTLDRGEGARTKLNATQRTIARRMVESTTQVPHFTVTAEVDMESAIDLRRQLRELGADPVPSLNDVVVRAVALALREFPDVNASYEDDHVVRWPRVNVGIAVALEGALLVPVVFDADRRSLAEIARESRRLAEAAQARTLQADELTQGTFTVSNLGMLGARRFTAVINPPQAAILAVGEVTRRAVVLESGELAARHRMDVTLSSDHRIVYGADAARFLQRVRELLERPLALVI